MTLVSRKSGGGGVVDLILLKKNRELSGKAHLI